MSEKHADIEGDLPPTGALPEPETEIVHTTRVSCDGSQSGLGHPRVWLQIPPDRGWVECGYCDKRYVLADDADTH
ncbi:zinc-finger domain-containing protein [Oceaniglobus roseus]|uniref:zinc-finger domain-containing protein n=1 Tax=Oceaniglobus roseus TaxID=1737570 RepID=UPI000C7ED4BA|nr:zinc-finger domain-containing protein [Kandeliimicrobium roseum]